MSVKNRLKIFIKHQGISISAFEKSIDAANGYVNSISKGIGLDKLQKIIEKYPNLDVKWLLIDKGDMLLQENGLHAVKEEGANYKVNNEYKTIISKLDTLLGLMDSKFEEVEVKLKTIELLTKMEKEVDEAGD